MAVACTPLLGCWGPDAGTQASRWPTAATHVGTTLAAGDRASRWAVRQGPGWRVRGTAGPCPTDRERAAPVVGLALPVALTAAAGPRRTPPRRAPDADHALA